MAVNIRNRSYTIAAEVDLSDGGRRGVLFAHGAQFGGHALYVKDGTLKYVYNFFGLAEQIVVATGRRRASVLSAAFEQKATRCRPPAR